MSRDPAGVNDPDLRSAEERRVDTVSRARFDELEARYRQLAGRLWLALAVIGATLVLAVLALIDSRSTERDQLQASRYDAAVQTCRSRNVEHQALIDFVAPFGRKLKDKARDAFPIEPDCDRYARKLIELPDQ